MAFTDGISPVPTVSSTQPNPSKSDLVGVAITVTVVGVLMTILVTWFVLRLRRVPQQQSIPIASRRPISYVVRPSFAPSEASSKFGFIRKSLRLSHRHRECTSWDFADPDPFAHPKVSLDTPLPSPTSQKHRPPPLAYVPRAFRTKDELSPRTPTTPVTPSIEFVEPPPPAYCRDSASSS